MAYLSFAELKTRSSFLATEWDTFVLETDAQLGVAPGTQAKITAWGEDIDSTIDDALRRRYAVPFDADGKLPPRAVKKWAAALYDEMLELHRRIPGSTEAQDAGVFAKAERARAEMRRAAEDVPAHPELPLAADKPETSGVVKGGPFLVEFVSPFDAWDFFASRRCL
jgi:hypothetical protein